MKKAIALLTILFTASLTVGCGGGGGNGGGEGGFYFDYDQIDNAQPIHTEKQKNYLNYDGSYYNITESQLSGFGINGRNDYSAPEQVSISWDYDAPSGKEVQKFSLTFGQKSDLSDGITVQGTAANSISFYNPFLGENYFKVTANFTDGTKEDSEIDRFQVEDKAPRNLYAGNMPNVRDMGGRRTVAGGKVKQGLIFRGAGNNFDQRGTTPNAECIDILTNQLGIKTEINVANSTGNNLNFTGVEIENCFMAYGKVPYSNLARNSVRVRQIMDVLADINNYPVYYHCRIGTDRTGITAVMINGLLGVPFEEILQDYLFSNFAPIDGLRFPHKSDDPNGDDIAKYIDAIEELPGKNFQEKVYLALRLIGVSAEKLDTIINIMTDGTKAQIPANIKEGVGDVFSSTTTKTTATDYKTPATYYSISANGSITYDASTTAGKKDVILYLGTTQSVSDSTTTKLSDVLSLQIDGVEQTIASTKNLWTAGFGHTDQDDRYGYMFNVLGSYTFTAGAHSLKISVKSGSFNIASIGVINR